MLKVPRLQAGVGLGVSHVMGPLRRRHAAFCQQNSAKKREQEQGEGDSPAPPRKIARTDRQEMIQTS